MKSGRPLPVVFRTTALTATPRFAISAIQRLNPGSSTSLLFSEPSPVRTTKTGARSPAFFMKRSSTSVSASISAVGPVSESMAPALALSFDRSVVGGTRTWVCRPVVTRTTSCSGGSASRNADTPARICTIALDVPALVSTSRATRIGPAAGEGAGLAPAAAAAGVASAGVGHAVLPREADRVDHHVVFLGALHHVLQRLVVAGEIHRHVDAVGEHQNLPPPLFDEQLVDPAIPPLPQRPRAVFLQPGPPNLG